MDKETKLRVENHMRPSPEAVEKTTTPFSWRDKNVALVYDSSKPHLKSDT